MMPTISPEARAIPLLKASAIPSSGSEIQRMRRSFAAWSLMMSRVPSVEPPSTRIYSRSGQSWERTLRMVSSRYFLLLKVMVMTENFTLSLVGTEEDAVRLEHPPCPDIGERREHPVQLESEVVYLSDHDEVENLSFVKG